MKSRIASLLFLNKTEKILVLCNTLFFNKSLESSAKVGNTGMFVLSPVTRQGKHYKVYIAVHLSRILMYFSSKLKFNKGTGTSLLSIKKFFSQT